MRDEHLVKEAKNILFQLNRSPKKSLGQNFLVDRNALKDIANAGKIKKDEKIVEIGAGLGWLTSELMKFFPKLTVVEKDDNFVEILNQNFGSTINLIHGDILDDNIWEKMPDNFKIIANIPYNLTTALIQKIILSNRVSRAVLLMQKEVAQRLCAKSGDSERGALTVALDTVANAHAEQIIGPTSFWPAPNVESQVLIINFDFNNHLEKQYIDFLFKGFCQKRRKIVNSLSTGLTLPKEKILILLKSSGVDSNLRPEDLTKDQWLTLWSKYLNMR